MTHPDKDKSEGATKRFQELGSAYTCLQKHFERLENPSWQDDFYYSDDDDDYEDEDNLQFFMCVFFHRLLFSATFELTSDMSQLRLRRSFQWSFGALLFP